MLSGHTGAVHAVVYNPNGQMLASAGADGTVRIREVATGETLVRCEGHRGGALSVAFTGDGTRIVTSGADGTARLWNASTGDLVVGLMERASTSRMVAPPGARWREGAVTVIGHPARVAFSASGQRCAIVGANGAIELFDMTTTLPIVWMEGNDQTIQSLTFTPDGRRLATGDASGTVILWDCRTGLEVLKLQAHTGRVAGLAFSRDGRLLFSAGADRVVRV